MPFNPVVIEKGLNAGFARAMAEFRAQRSLAPGLMQAALEITSTSAYEKLGWLGSMPAVQQWLGELKAEGFENYDYTVRNLDWAAAATINENDVADDQTGTLQLVPQMLARRVMTHPERIAIDLIKNGVTGLAYDGVAFFSDATGARTIDNLRTGTGITLAQIEADLDSALTTMAQFKDDKGEEIGIIGDMIVCPKALENKFRRLINSQTDPTGTVEGTFNPYAGRFTVVGDPRLSDANDWYLLATGEVIKPFVFSMRQEAENRFEKKNLTKNWVWSADYRGNAGYALPHLAIKVSNT